jgi:hypothetical protein
VLEETNTYEDSVLNYSAIIILASQMCLNGVLDMEYMVYYDQLF